MSQPRTMPPIATYALFITAAIMILANILKHPIGLMSFHINIPGVLLILSGILIHRSSQSENAYKAALIIYSLGTVWLLFWSIVLLSISLPA